MLYNIKKIFFKLFTAKITVNKYTNTKKIKYSFKWHNIKNMLLVAKREQMIVSICYYAL